MTTEEPLPKKVRLSEADFKVMAREELMVRWKEYEAYVQALEDRYAGLSASLAGLRESEERLRRQRQAALRREDILALRLATKEHEIREVTAQIQRLRHVRPPPLADPATSFCFRTLTGELEGARAQLERTRGELSAWQFSPASQTGRDLMARCRLLLQENQRLGRRANRDLAAQLEAELALQRRYSEELRSSRGEMSGFILRLEEEAEAMQGTILALQRQLQEAHQQLARYRERGAPGPGPLASAPQAQAAAPGEGCSPLVNGPSGDSSSLLRTAGSGCPREEDRSADGLPSSQGTRDVACTSSEGCESAVSLPGSGPSRTHP